MMPLSLTFRWLFPMTGEPIAGGTLTIDGSEVQSVGSDSAPPDAEQLSLEHAAVLPGWMNAHTHLEFSTLAEPLPARETFAEWIAHVVESRRSDSHSTAQACQAIRQGIAESLAGGATTIGEIATMDISEHPLRDGPASGVVFRELLGLQGERAEQQRLLAESHLRPRNSDGGQEQSDVRLGLSPHAPYTASPTLVQTACRLSRSHHVPLAMHLAESLDELELLQSHSGPLVELLRSLDAWDAASIPRGIRPFDYLAMLAESERALVIHGNFLGADELQFLAEQRQKLSVVFCPRTFAHFDHGRYPLAEMLQAGVRVVLGTDSRASNPDLSLFREMQWVRDEHGLAPRQILEMVTREAAAALGLAHICGTLESGKRADLVIVRLPPRDDVSPWDLVLDDDASIEAVVVNGKWIQLPSG